MNDRSDSNRSGRRPRGRHHGAGGQQSNSNSQQTGRQSSGSQNAGRQSVGSQHTGRQFGGKALHEEERQQSKQSRRPSSHDRSRNEAHSAVNQSLFGSERAKAPFRSSRKFDFAPIHTRKIEPSTCARCGHPIQDMSAAIADKGTGVPVHFDCVLEFLQKSEELNKGEKVVYIGQGRFAVVYLENPQDTRKFKIIRIIEWEDKEKKQAWRAEISGIFTHIQ